MTEQYQLCGFGKYRLAILLGRIKLHRNALSLYLAESTTRTYAQRRIYSLYRRTRRSCPTHLTPKNKPHLLEPQNKHPPDTHSSKSTGSSTEMCQITMTVCTSCSHIYRVHLHQCGPVRAHLPESRAFTVADFFWSPFNGCQGMLFCRPVKVEERCFACMDDTDIAMAVDLEDDGDEVVGEKEGEEELNGWHLPEVENNMEMGG